MCDNDVENSRLLYIWNVFVVDTIDVRSIHIFIKGTARSGIISITFRSSKNDRKKQKHKNYSAGNLNRDVHFIRSKKS